MLRLNLIQKKMHNAIIATVDTEVSDEEAAQRTFSYIKVSTEAHYDDSKNYVEYTDDEKAELEKLQRKSQKKRKPILMQQQQTTDIL